MKILDRLRFRLATLFRRSHVNADMEEELRSHVQLRADDLERGGLSRWEAERRARLEFGGEAKFEEQCREAAGGAFLDSLKQDVRYGLRMLCKSPSFTAIAVATLALAIGANTVVFATLNALILRPLNVPEPQSLYALEHGSDNGFQSYPDYLDLRDRNRAFENLAAYNVTSAGLTAGDTSSRAWVEEVTGNYFDTLEVEPYLGRFIHASDEHGPNSAPYIVLTYAYWHAHFQDDRSVVGRTVELNKYPYTIVGVTPPGFHGTLLIFQPDFFVPIVNSDQVDGGINLNDRGYRWIFESFGHLKPGVTPAQATADLNAVGAELAKTYPKEDAGRMTFDLARPNLYGNFLGRPVKAFLAGLMLLAALILLAACTNLGSLFAARAADRRRELAMRVALGASQARVVRQLFTEALLISLLGGAVGMWASVMLLRALATWQPFPQFPLYMPVHPDSAVYGMALLLALVSGFLFGAVPVRQVLRTDPYEVVKAGPSGTAGRRVSLRDVLLVAQIAICAVLVTSSFVAVRGLARSLRSNFGFQPRNAMLVDIALKMAGYTGDAVPPMQKRILEALQSIPGVTGVGMADVVPLSGGGNTSIFFTGQTADLRPSNAAAEGYIYNISPGYIEASGTALLTGRTFTWQDDVGAPHVAIVNQTFARKIFGSEHAALGRNFKLRDGTPVQAVGVVQDGKYFSIAEDPQTAVFLPVLQSPVNETITVVRFNGDAHLVAAAIGDTLRELDSGLPYDMRTWEQTMDGALFPPRIATAALGVLGVMGAMLSLTGIFGVAAYSVSRRRKDLGIRMALGAQRKDVLEAALARPLKLLAAGSVAGLILGILASRVLAVIVYQATPRDPVVLTGVVLAMGLLGLVATWIPAQRALSIDPLTLLREE
jgi:predicted permease